MKKEVLPKHDAVACDVCGRTILKGEAAEPYLAGGERRLVCELCRERAVAEGWIPEAHGAAVAGQPRRASGRRSLLGRLRRRDDEQELDLPPGGGESLGLDPVEQQPDAAAEELEPAAPTPEQASSSSTVSTERSGPRDPRHVRAVPSNAQLKVERALDLFNQSEHPRTVAGITRTLGGPWVSANPLADTPSAVAIVVAWELSWYRYRVDLADSDRPVTLVDTGEELGELAEDLRAWNAVSDDEGRLGVAAVDEEVTR